MIEFLGIIPARKNSKRIKNKNLQLLGGKKLIEYTFKEARNSKLMEDVILTTDDTKIIKLSKKYKIKSPFIRPKNLSGSLTSMESVIIHALKYYKKKYLEIPTHFLVLQPTSPFRSRHEIDDAIKKYLTSKSSSLVSVSEPLNPLDEIYITKKNVLINNYRKDKSTSYFLNGSIYIRNTKDFLKTGKLIKKNSNFFITPKISSIDINDKIDLALAKYFIRK